MSPESQNPYASPQNRSGGVSIQPVLDPSVSLEILRLSLRGFILGGFSLLMSPVVFGLFLSPIAILFGSRARELHSPKRGNWSAIPRHGERRPVHGLRRHPDFAGSGFLVRFSPRRAVSVGFARMVIEQPS